MGVINIYHYNAHKYERLQQKTMKRMNPIDIVIPHLMRDLPMLIANGKLVMLRRTKIKFGMTISMGLLVTKKALKKARNGENVIKIDLLQNCFTQFFSLNAIVVFAFRKPLKAKTTAATKFFCEKLRSKIGSASFRSGSNVTNYPPRYCGRLILRCL